MTKRTATTFKRIPAVTFFLLNLTVCQLSAQHVINGPYLIKPGNIDMTIRWELNEKGNYFAEYGKDTLKTKNEPLQYRGSKQGAFLYEAKLPDLREGTVYYYRLTSQNESNWHKIKTFTGNQKQITFMAMGDSRSNPDIFKKVMEETDSINPDFFIGMGDLVESGGNYRQWHDFFFSVIKGYAESTPIVSTLGDHEAEGDGGELFRYYLLTDEPVGKQWFSFDYGITHFISLDYRYPDKREMIDWFIKDITTSGKEWNFVFMHRGAYNFGGHRTAWGRDIWPELFGKYKIDIVFAGHSHLYERFFPVRSDDEVNAVTYVTTGGAGAGLYQSVKNKFVLAKTESVNHFVVVKIDGNKLTLKAIRMDGSTRDELEIVKNKKGYNKSYEKQIISQEELNTITSLNSAISNSLSEIPLFGHPAKYELNLHSYLSEIIPYSIQIDRSSAGIFDLKMYNDTLYPDERKNIELHISRSADIKISPWGEITPELRLKLIYEYNAEKDTIVGKALDYWPGDSY